MDNIGIRLSKYLTAINMNQVTVAELSGNSTATISRFCRGAPINSNKIETIIKALPDMNLEWLFFGNGPMTKDGNLKSDIKEQDNPYMTIIMEKDRQIAARDSTISQRDKVICRLQEQLK